MRRFILPQPQKVYKEEDEKIRNREITANFLHVQQEIARLNKIVEDLEARIVVLEGP